MIAPDYHVPTMTLPPPGCDKSFWDEVWSGYRASQSGSVDIALKCYESADRMLSQGRLNPSLSVLRHNVGEGEGSVVSVEPTEDQVWSVFLGERSDEIDNAEHFVENIPEFHIRRVVENMSPGHHIDNIKEERPHVMVMSTGRCGTMSLYRLFKGSNLEPYHAYWFNVAAVTRWEMRCRLIANNHEDFGAAAEWACTRAAEWLGDKPMIGLSHVDTIFAPVFAAIHKKSKFVYLERDSGKVFYSFHSKDQWCGGANHFVPIRYDFNRGFQFTTLGANQLEGIEHHINATEKFCNTFGKVLGDRWIKISADKLFDQDPKEIEKLLSFVGSDVSIAQAVSHFKVPVNVKAHRAA